MKGTTMNRERFGYMVFGGLLVLAGFVIGSLSQPNRVYASSSGDGGACGAAVAGVVVASGDAAFFAVLPSGEVMKCAYKVKGTPVGWTCK